MRPDPFPAQPGRATLRVTCELGKEAGNVCLRRNRRAPQAFPAGGHRRQREVLANRNVPNGAEPILKVIGDLPTGTPAAFEAAFGTG